MPRSNSLRTINASTSLKEMPSLRVPMEVYCRLPSRNNLEKMMKKWHPPALVRVYASGYQALQGFLPQPTVDRMPSAPSLSNTPQLYLTDGHNKMVCLVLPLVVCALIYHIGNAHGMESSVLKCTCNWVRLRRRNTEPTRLTRLTRGGDSIVCLWEIQWPTPQGQTPFSLLTSIEHCPKEEGDFIDIFGLDWSPDGNYLASCCGDSIVRVWSKVMGKLIYAEKVHRATVVQVRWSPDGQYLASGSVDTTICLIDFKTKGIARRYNDIGGRYRLAEL